MAIREELGFITSSSGKLVVIDTGYLRLWSHDQSPTLPDGELDSEEATKRANSFVDLQILGPDAEQAGQILGMSCHRRYIFDQPPDYDELQNKLTAVVRSHDLDATFRVISPRLSHQARADLALEQNGAGEIQVHGVPAVVMGGAPVSVPMRVLGERMEPPEQHRWRRVLVECRPHVSVAQSARVGFVGVDHARLLIADLTVLGIWKHEVSLDGKADFVFWGHDAARAAKQFGAQVIENEGLGWRNLPEDEAIRRGTEIEVYRDKNNLDFATDYRPHSHHWQVMQPTRKSLTESGMTEIAGMTVCNFMTTWGDGIFAVHRDLSANGDLVNLNIELVPDGDEGVA